MDSNTAIIACETLKGELELVMDRERCVLPVTYVESGLHAWPEKLHTRLQEVLDALPPEYTTVLLLFGFCGNSLVGITAGHRTLVLPRVADCIPLFLGSQQRRAAAGNDTYFLTQGYLSGEQNIVSEHDYYLARYGEQRATRLTKTLMKHYKKFAVIDTGAFEPDLVATKVAPYAAILDVPVEVVPGDLVLLCELLAGGLDESRFLHVPPGGSVSFEDSLDLGQSQILSK